MSHVDSNPWAFSHQQPQRSFASGEQEHSAGCLESSLAGGGFPLCSQKQHAGHPLQQHFSRAGRATLSQDPTSRRTARNSKGDDISMQVKHIPAPTSASALCSTNGHTCMHGQPSWRIPRSQEVAAMCGCRLKQWSCSRCALPSMKHPRHARNNEEPVRILTALS